MEMGMNVHRDHRDLHGPLLPPHRGRDLHGHRASHLGLMLTNLDQ